MPQEERKDPKMTQVSYLCCRYCYGWINKKCDCGKIHIKSISKRPNINVCQDCWNYYFKKVCLCGKSFVARFRTQVNCSLVCANRAYRKKKWLKEKQSKPKEITYLQWRTKKRLENVEALLECKTLLVDIVNHMNHWHPVHSFQQSSWSVPQSNHPTAWSGARFQPGNPRSHWLNQDKPKIDWEDIKQL